MGCGKDECKTRFWGTSSFPLRGSTGANILNGNSDKKAAVRSLQLRIYYPAAARDQRGERNWSSVHYYRVLHSTFMPYLYFRKLHDFWEDFNAVGVSNYSMHAPTVHDGCRNGFRLVTTNINFLQLFQLGHFAMRTRVWDLFLLLPMYILFRSHGKSNGFHYFRKTKLQTQQCLSPLLPSDSNSRGIKSVLLPISITLFVKKTYFAYIPPVHQFTSTLFPPFLQLQLFASSRLPPSTF